MHVHILQHVPFEGIGSIQTWLTAKGATVSYTRFFEDPILPAPDTLDLVIAMGGPMSVNDEAELPWLKGEKQFILDCIAEGTPVLGICLGAQLIANALGGRVYPGPQREIGWYDIEAVTAAEGTFAFPAKVEVFHWHGETFDLPQGAVRLARSTVCENQAFQVGPRVIGLQFHLETTPESADAIITHCRDELQAGPTVQTEDSLRAVPVSAYEPINHLMAEVLDYLTREGR